MANGRQTPRPAHGPTAIEPDEILPTSTSGLREQQTRGEIDIQIATAKRYPRSIETFQKKALTMATVDEETAASCFYVLPKRKGSEKLIEGPSARLAEIVSSAWGHLRIVGRIVEEGDRMVTAYGGCWDLETNVARAVEVRRRITTREGARFGDDMIVVTSNAAIAIATRNAVFQVVPQAYTRQIYLECRKVAIGTAETLGSRRAKLLEYFQKLGVEPGRVFALLEVRGQEDITLEHVATMRGLATAIREGDTSIDDAFPLAGTTPTADPVDVEMALIPEATRGKIAVAFEAAKMNRGQRLVQLRAWKGQPDKLLEVLTGMLDAQKAEGDGSVPGAAATRAVEQPPAAAAPSAPNGVTGSQEREARGREMPSPATGGVGAATPSSTAPADTPGGPRFSF